MKNRFFTSSAWVIALLFWVLYPLSMSAQAGITSNRKVIFLHGLNEDFSTWQPFSNRFIAAENRLMSPFNQTYGSVGSLGTIFSGVSTSGSGASSLAICHSLGGVVARNLDRANTGNFVGGIITVGSPMDGAPVANAVLDGTVRCLEGLMPHLEPCLGLCLHLVPTFLPLLIYQHSHKLFYYSVIFLTWVQ
jgi:triacylglycerol esterase/lipase EstA (alpha/beta hydrolase family)